MNLSYFRTSLFIALISIAFNMVPFSSSVTAAFKYLQEGMEAPPLKGQDLVSGGQINYDDLTGSNVVIITFWSTWSSRSLELLGDLKLFSDENSGRPVKIIAVNVDNQKISTADETKIRKIVAEMNLPFTVMIDYGLETFYEYGVIAVPSTAILDTSGVLRYAPSGYSLTTRDRIKDSLDVLLGLKEPETVPELRQGYTPLAKSSRYYRLAQELAHQGMYERALANLQYSEEADTLFSAPHNLRGQIYLKLDSVGLAKEEFARALQLDSTSIAAMSGLARALILNGQSDKACELLLSLLEDDPAYTPALLDYALCLAEKGQFDKALEYLAEARSLNPREPMVYYYLGRIYLDSGRINDAINAFRDGLDILYPEP